MRSLDRIDRELLAHLQRDARISNKDLAERVGLAPSTCLERVRRLWEAGLFLGFHAELEPRALGIGLEAMVAVRLRRHSEEHAESFRKHALSLAPVRALYHLGGSHDFLLHVVVRDADHLRHLVLNAFTIHEEVAHAESSLIYGYGRNPVLPIYEPAFGAESESEEREPVAELR